MNTIILYISDIHFTGKRAENGNYSAVGTNGAFYP